MNPIQNIPPLPTPPTLATGGTTASQDPTEFKSFLLDSIQEVNSMQQAADQAVEKLATGGDVNPAEVLTAVQKADIAFRMMIQVRNKLVDVYDNVMAIRV